MNKINYQPPKEKVDTDEILDMVFKDSSVKHGLQEFSKEILKRINAFDPKKTKISEDRYYFSNGKMVRWLDENNKEVNTNREEFKEAEKRVMNFSNELAAKFKRKT